MANRGIGRTSAIFPTLCSRWCDGSRRCCAIGPHWQSAEGCEPMFLARDQTRPYTYGAAMSDLARMLERVGVQETYGLHSLRVSGYNWSKRGNGVDITVAHGLCRAVRRARRWARRCSSVHARRRPRRRHVWSPPPKSARLRGGSLLRPLEGRARSAPLVDGSWLTSWLRFRRFRFPPSRPGFGRSLTRLGRSAHVGRRGLRRSIRAK